MVTGLNLHEYELEDAPSFRTRESRTKFEVSSKARFNTRSRYARGKGSPTLSGAHRRRARRSVA